METVRLANSEIRKAIGGLTGINIEIFTRATVGQDMGTIRGS